MAAVGGDTVHYHYAGIEAAAGEMTRISKHAQALLDVGRAGKSSFAASWQGTSSTSFQDAFHRFETVNESNTDVALRAAQSLITASQGMQGTELSNASMFV